MKIVIIEDEKLTATNLAETIMMVVHGAQITSILSSVQSAITWFQHNEQPDLIFADIQLGDGLCFDIFKAVTINAPVIFCTAFDEYALKAFDANGIDYILKPFDKKSISDAFQKYHNLKVSFSGEVVRLDQIIQLIEKERKQIKTSVLVFRQDKIIPVRFTDIAIFYIENEITKLVTFDHKTYTINKTMEKVEEIAPDDFFRVNRQFLINHKAIKDASQYFGRKLSVSLTIPFTGTITVSKNNVTAFLNWLSGY
jgi:two-component system, LytTR family, response regulator LytT